MEHWFIVYVVKLPYGQEWWGYDNWSDLQCYSTKIKNETKNDFFWLNLEESKNTFLKNEHIGLRENSVY